MRRAIAALMVGGLMTALACGNSADGNVCQVSGGTCVAPGSGLVCEDTMALPCPGDGVVCCAHAQKGVPPGGQADGG